MTHLRKITELDNFIYTLDQSLFMADKNFEQDINFAEGFIGDMSTLIPKVLIVAYLAKIDILQDGTQRTINETELWAIPSYTGNGQLDDPNEYAKQDLEELEILSKYVDYLNLLEYTFTNELYNRETFINNI